MEITKQTTMGSMLKYDRGIAYILMQSGMHCVGCPSSISETIEQKAQSDINWIFPLLWHY